MPRKKKQPNDANQLGKFVVDSLTDSLPEEPEPKQRNSRLTPERRSELARNAARARWGKK